VRICDYSTTVNKEGRPQCDRLALIVLDKYKQDAVGKLGIDDSTWIGLCCGLVRTHERKARQGYLTGDGALDTKTGQVCYAGIPKVDDEDWSKLKTRLPLCKDLR